MTSIFRRCLYSFWCALLMALVGLASGAQGKIIHVPADEPTIRAGINAASNGETVLASPGTYGTVSPNQRAIIPTFAKSAGRIKRGLPASERAAPPKAR